MDRKTSEKASELLTKINDLSQSADDILELINGIKSNEAELEIVVHGNAKQKKMELSQIMAEKICKEFLESYYEVIRRTKDELDKVIESVIP